MKMKKIAAIICLLVVTATGFSQEKTSPVVDAYSEDVKQCLKSNGTYAYYDNVVDNMFKMLKKQYASKNVPTDVWQEVESIKPQALDLLLQMLVSSYRAHFKHDDVKKMNALYASKAGKNMFKQDALTKGDKVVLKEFYESETGQKITSSQESMSKSMSEISEIWSRDLYQTVVKRLSEKGYELANN